MASTTSRKSVKKSAECFVETTLAAIGGRWKVLVIFHLLKGKQRFGELTRLLGGISARTLTRQLRELEKSGVIDRFVYQEIPPKVEYSLTPLGRQLEPVLQAMHEWGAQLEKVQHSQASRRSKG
ncbi:winged helix-turn-helix transcriptional regulator [Planctomicrobium sp. SH527]|uniref:winged helix-turn-helix transcriptional regulator n=1 Tax=Planctomicrobium sp. SH527 TaxID=3448123 RepID=UPI003F5C3625